MSSEKENPVEKPMFVLIFAGVGCFMLSLLGMGIAPWMGLGLEPPEEMDASNPYIDEDSGETTAAGRGRETYINEGCWHCHSQFVRPVGNEEFRYGPVSQAWESMHDVPNTYGTRRVGPDLAREAGRRTDDWHLAHLWNPRATVPNSIMPKYPWMYEETADGWKPTEKATDLVAYLQTLGHHFEKDVHEQVWPKRVSISGTPRRTEINAKRGEELWGKNCVGCHGERGDGNGLAKDFLIPSAADLTTRYLPRAEVYRVLYMGSEGSSMPSFIELPEKDLWALAQYVSDLGRGAKKPALKTVADAKVSAGKTVYEKNGCTTCHGDNAGVPANRAFKPAPKEFKDRLYHPDYLKRVMVEGRPGTTMAPYPQIQGGDLENLIAYLSSLYDKSEYDKHLSKGGNE
ncbi:cbb3-type cytochrome c oxidase subunit II [Planctomycetota bacterium]|nr:cbb3-type cytochrome c oxidase subunit II [Planctomycetota bacterium]